jgi:hypothetical protein
MTKKHFKALAEALRETRPDLVIAPLEYKIQWNSDVRAVANACRTFNPLFDYGKFINACGGLV